MQMKIIKLLELFQIHIRRLYISYFIVAFFVFTLFLWYTFNVTKMLHKYFLYETIVSLHDNPPVWTHFPGITVCAPSIFKPQQLAEMYPEFEIQFRNFKRRIASLPQHEALKEIENSRKSNARLLTNYESLAMQDYGATEVIHKLSVQQADLIVDCKYYPLNSRPFYQIYYDSIIERFGSRGCTEMQTILPSIYEGRKCFTFFSRLGNSEMTFFRNKTHNQSKCNDDEFCQVLKDSDTHMVYDLNPSIVLHLKALESDIWSAYIEDNVQVVVLPNRSDFRFHDVRSNTLYDIKFSKRISLLQPPPYQTMCVNYTTESKFVRQKIKTQDHCISRCVDLYLKTHFEMSCNSYFNFLIEAEQDNTKICNHTIQNFTDYLEARDYCLSTECPDDCITISYEVDGQAISTASDEAKCPSWYMETDEDEDLVEKLEDSSLRCDPRVLFRISSKPFTTVQHRIAISTETFIGTLGGHLGIWLGLSLYRFIKILLYILYMTVKQFVYKK